MNLPDAAARARAKEDLAANLSYEAGAGTGKTHLLIDRLEQLIVAGGLPISQIVAITFTRKAAGELKDKLRKRLEEAAARRSEPAATALQGLDSAPIGTIDSFTQNLLATYPLEAGLPPAFTMLEPIQESTRFSEWWEDAFLDLSSDPDCVPAWDALEDAGLDPGPMKNSLEDLARAMFGEWWRLRDTDFRSVLACTVSDLGVQAGVAALDPELQGCREAEDKLAAKIRSLVARFEAAEDAEPDEAIAGLASIEAIRNVGRAAAWGGNDEVKRVRALAIGAQKVLAREGPAALRMGQCAPLVERMRSLVLEAIRLRQSAGEVTFGDALSLAVNLLQARSDIRQALRARYLALLVDEFQDTSPLQVELVGLLARDPETEQLDAGRLFLVGDPKQSIYRFRGADAAAYTGAVEQPNLERCELTSSFRSHPDILGVVNDLFQAIFQPAEGQARPTDLEATIGSELPCRAVFWGQQDPHGGELEAEWAVAWIRQAVAEEWKVGQPESKRPIRLRDIAVLFPRRSVLDDLRRSLEGAAIPYRVESQTGLFRSQPERDLLNILAAMDDPWDEVAVVGALRSAAFGCTDDELAQWRLQGGDWRLVGIENDPDRVGPVADAMAVLRELRSQTEGLGLAARVQETISRCGLMEACAGLPRPRTGWQKLKGFVDQAIASESDSGRSLRGFLRWAWEQVEERAATTDSAVPESDEDAVRLMTVHAAKGLEFPMVIVMGFAALKRPRPSRLVWGQDGQPLVRIGSEEAGVWSAGMAQAREAAKQADALEEERLLYVAMTRAQNDLIVSTWSERNSALVRKVRDLVADRHLPSGEPNPGDKAFEPPPRPPSAAPSAREQWIVEQKQLVEGLARQPRRTATAAAHELEEDHDPEARSHDDLKPGIGGRRAGTAIGRAVHTVLQTIDLRSSANLEALCRAQATAEGVDFATVAALVRNALNSEQVRRAAQGRFWREVYVGAHDDDTLLEGFVDLLFEGPDGLVVVDYKTDGIRTSEEAEAKVESGYGAQGAFYREALELALRKTISQVFFVFVATSPPIEIAV